MNKATFEEVLAEKGELIYTHVGDSMAPQIQPRDLLIIKPPSFPLKRLDIPLYQRDNGQYVLHRIIRVKGHDYVICGDNRVTKEYGIGDCHVIGVLTDIVRDGKQISVYDLKHRIYAHLWCDLFLIRKVIIKTRNVIKRYAIQ